MIFTALDPVCRTKIKKRNAIVKLKYRDKTYYFCSSSCKKTFREMPKKYLPEKQLPDKIASLQKKSRKRGCCG
jgi:Cu+-exporting ATPase